MDKINTKLLESAILFLLVLDIFRSQFITNLIVLGIVAVALVVFMVFSLPTFAKSTSFGRGRFIFFLIIVFAIHGFILSQKIAEREMQGKAYWVHDGVLQTEFAASALENGQNPYAISYRRVLVGQGYNVEGKEAPVVAHYDYSPVMFLVNLPIFNFTEGLFNIVDMRISLVIFLFLAAFVGAYVVGEKILFLTLFLLNPIFLPLMYFGANDSILLFFVLAAFVSLIFKKYIASTVLFALACGTKIIVLPIVPLYFVYLFWVGKRDKSLNLSRQFIYFLLASAVIYLPFIIWDFYAIYDDLIAYVFLGGGQNHPIVGYFGLQQMLFFGGLISESSTFPYYIFLVPVAAVFLIVSFKILRNSLNLATLCVLYVLFSLALLFFSKVLQTNYLAFLSQILIFSGFVKLKK